MVYSHVVEEHAEHLRKVFIALMKHCLFAKTSKCRIMVKEVEFLGQWVTPQGASPLKEKLKAICSWERHQTVKDIRSFWGFANYYHHFISKYAEIAAPLTYLTKKDVEIQWGPPQQRAFQQLKDALCDAPMLGFLDPKLPYAVVTDASGMGDVILRVHSNVSIPAPVPAGPRRTRPY